MAKEAWPGLQIGVSLEVLQRTVGRVLEIEWVYCYSFINIEGQKCAEMFLLSGEKEKERKLLGHFTIFLQLLLYKKEKQQRLLL